MASSSSAESRLPVLTHGFQPLGGFHNARGSEIRIDPLSVWTNAGPGNRRNGTARRISVSRQGNFARGGLDDRIQQMVSPRQRPFTHGPIDDRFSRVRQNGARTGIMEQSASPFASAAGGWDHSGDGAMRLSIAARMRRGRSVLSYRRSFRRLGSVPITLEGVGRSWR